MSGMAGNVTAFNTVWTYDLYQTYIAPGRPDRHYLRVGRIATVAGVAISIGTAYLALHFENMFDYWALLSSIFIATSFATFLLGIFTRRVTSMGAFCGMLVGFAVAIGHYILYERGVIHYGSIMEMDFMDGTYGFGANAVVAWVVSLEDKRKPDAGIEGTRVLGYGSVPAPGRRHLDFRPARTGGGGGGVDDNAERHLSIIRMRR